MSIKTIETKKDPRGGARAGAGRKKSGRKKYGKIERIDLEFLAKLTQKKTEFKKTWNEFLAYLLDKID